MPLHPLVERLHDPLIVPTLPAMAVGVTDRLFDVSDLVALLVQTEKKAASQ
jgi:hypothetical protein